MRTGADYKESLRDGRDVWVVGEGPVEDVTTHPATSAMVDEYVAWYDRHFDPDWQDILLTPSDGNGHRHPLALTPPRTSDDLRRMGRAISAVHFITGGNITHTAGYGHLIAMGMTNALKRLEHSAEEIASSEAYLEDLGCHGPVPHLRRRRAAHRDPSAPGGDPGARRSGWSARPPTAS